MGYFPLGHQTGALPTVEKPPCSCETKREKNDELVAKLTEHYSPTPSEVMQRFCFNSRLRKAGESVSTYVVKLRRLAQHFNYGDALDKMLRDRIAWGINDEATQKKLLQVKDLTYTKTVSVVQGFKIADKNLKEMHVPNTEPTSNSSVGV